MGMLFYVKIMGGTEVILKEQAYDSVQGIEVDPFMSAHQVNLWFTYESVPNYNPWEDETSPAKRYWMKHHAVKGRWAFCSELEVPKILLMRVLVGAI